MSSDGRKARRKAERRGTPGRTGKPRVGVYVCHAGSTSRGTVDCEAAWALDAAKPRGVVLSEHQLYTLLGARPGKDQAATSPSTPEPHRCGLLPPQHEPTFQESCVEGAA